MYRRSERHLGGNSGSGTPAPSGTSTRDISPLVPDKSQSLTTSAISTNRQQQVLDGVSIKKLTVGKGSLAYARMRVKVAVASQVTYDVYPGDVAQQSPEFEF